LKQNQECIMKKVFPLLSLALLIVAQAAVIQAQTKNGRAKHPTKKTATVVQATEQSEQTTPPDTENLNASPATAAATPLTDEGANAATSDAPGKTMTTVPGAASVTAQPSTSAPVPPESIYRVGVGDVLDIHLLNSQTRESTLFTVMPGGLLEYPLAGEPLQVSGLTTDEIDARLTAKIQVYEKPQVIVSVRDYVSHNVIVTGLVNEPGSKALRREAVPLYVVLAEAQPRPEAGKATILRPGGQSFTIDLSDTNAAAALVFPGDVISLSAPPPAPPQYFYIGGQVTSPGQKDFHAGMTLTQAVLASGGVTRYAGSKVKVSRQGANGLLVKTEYNLKQIEDGKIPDPVLQAGDRLEVSRSGW
jgi:protein involved in polysaccharide export with SLBB domain